MIFVVCADATGPPFDRRMPLALYHTSSRLSIEQMYGFTVLQGVAEAFAVLARPQTPSITCFSVFVKAARGVDKKQALRHEHHQGQNPIVLDIIR